MFQGLTWLVVWPQVLLHVPLSMQIDPAGVAGALRVLTNAQVRGGEVGKQGSL